MVYTSVKLTLNGTTSLEMPYIDVAQSVQLTQNIILIPGRYFRLSRESFFFLSPSKGQVADTKHAWKMRVVAQSLRRLAASVERRNGDEAYCVTGPRSVFAAATEPALRRLSDIPESFIPTAAPTITLLHSDFLPHVFQKRMYGAVARKLKGLVRIQ